MTPSEIKQRVNAVYPGCIAFQVYGDNVSIVLSDFKKIRVTIESLALVVTDQAEESTGETQPVIPAQAGTKKKQRRVQL